MPPGTQTRGALALGNQSLGLAQRMNEQGTGLQLQALRILQQKRDRILAEVDRIRQEREAKKAEPDAGPLGGFGAVGGAVAGAALAPFTGGLSLVASAGLGASLGGGLESAIQGDSGGATRAITSGIETFLGNDPLQDSVWLDAGKSRGTNVSDFTQGFGKFGAGDGNN